MPARLLFSLNLASTPCLAFPPARHKQRCRSQPGRRAKRLLLPLPLL
jgi:hypothetical protein